MGLSAVTYALAKNYAKKYVDETAAQFGALKGANCTIKSIVKENGQSIVTFEWKNDKGEIRESILYVDDGTNILVWTPGSHYKYGDIALYGDAFYRCITENEDVVFDSLKWNAIGSPDGDYDIVQSSSLLPPRYTPADRKMYYCIEEDCFYFWDGYKWDPISAVVKASADTLGGVRIDDGTINLDDNGKISINTITQDDIDKLFE